MGATKTKPATDTEGGREPPDRMAEAVRLQRQLHDTPHDHPARQWIRRKLWGPSRELVQQLCLGWGGDSEDDGWWHRRVTFPYIDADSRCPSIAGRTLDQRAAESDKWWVTANSVAVRRKSELLWGLDAETARRIAGGATPYLVEGPGDAARILSLRPDLAVVGPVGVAVNAGQLRQINELRDGEIIVPVYADNDKGGAQMCKTLARLAPEVPELILLDCRQTMPLGCDPGDLDDEQLAEALLCGIDPPRLWAKPSVRTVRKRRDNGPRPQWKIDGDDRKERVKREASITRWIEAACEMRGDMAVCPFHDDTNPSLHVKEDEGRWSCYGCDAWGDVYTWVMWRYNVGFSEAIDMVEADNRGGRVA